METICEKMARAQVNAQEPEPTPRINKDDPWTHQSAGMRCVSCMWFVEKFANRPQLQSHFVGRCRRHAPTMNGYPVVFSDDWCGDHKLNENKI